MDRRLAHLSGATPGTDPVADVVAALHAAREHTEGLSDASLTALLEQAAPGAGTPTNIASLRAVLETP